MVESGSQITAWAPDPGDKLDPKMRLRAANNTFMKCYGFKEVTVRIGRKEYKFRAIKLKVALN